MAASFFPRQTQNLGVEGGYYGVELRQISLGAWISASSSFLTNSTNLMGSSLKLLTRYCCFHPRTDFFKWQLTVSYSTTELV